MTKKENLITGIDIGSHAIKVCQLQRIGKTYKLLSIGSALLPLGAVEDGMLQEPLEVREVLSSLLKNLKIKNKKIGVSISGYSVIVKKINLEEMEDEALVAHIKAEAEQYVPFDSDDVYIDFQKLPAKKDETGRCEVMLVAAKKEVVNGYLDMLNELKLNAVLVDIDSFALENIWETVSGCPGNVTLVDIGASKMSINIISDGVSVLARDVAVGSSQLTDQIANALNIENDQAENIKLGILDHDGNEEIIENIFNKTCTQWMLEIKKAIDFYLVKNQEQALMSIVLSGGGSKVSGLKEYISRETGLDVIAFNPFVNMLCNGKKFDDQYLTAVAPGMAIAAGLAIRSASF